MKFQLLSAFILVSILCAGIVRAGSIPIPNGNFETDPLPDGAFNFSATNWTSFGGVGFGAGAFNPTTASYAGEAPEGERAGWMIAYNSAGLAQTLSATYQAGYTYTLTALVGDRDDYARAYFRLALLANGLAVSAGGDGPNPPEGAFSLVTATFDADESVHGLPIEVRLLAFTSSEVDPDQPPGSGGTIVDYDDVQLDSSVTVTAVTPQTPSARGFALHPPVPNPFNPRTMVAFDVPAPSTVSLHVFDASGRLIRELMNGQRVPGGRREVEWDGRDDLGQQVASGVYFCRLTTGGSTATVRMVLLK